ncbi:HAMP domain-containing histidine kinase [Nocardioides sp. HDW12B]|uniref:sensor histidine kinase n=1 Tax=Nocardioides sp. HDW12B TaxID=2714939 RepID=UPI00140D98AA|nr:HAMP domain-containing sensor histidine kinase [Nocardioides sp. HDW12B]QIK65877.1 HAMP domain-containing histidine kinase [Nocardioides sp. HDW12B]
MGSDTLRHVVEVAEDLDVLRAREAARTVALALGSADVVATRVTVCVGSLAHDLAVAGGGRVELSATHGEPLRVRCTPRTATATSGRGPEPVSWAASAPAVALLADRTSLGDGADEATVALMVEDVVHALTADEVDVLRHRLAEPGHSTWADHLHDQGRDLMMVLAQLQSRDESPRERMEAESAADADGIIGLYHELSEELERTNQGVVALYAEIDDKSRQLREASEAKTRFMRNISHELRSPSNSIIGLARLLLDSGAESQLVDEQREQVNFIEASARDLLGLVDELLDLAAAESGRMDATAEAVDLAELFDELSGVTRPLLRSGVSLHVRPPEPGTTLHTDRTLLRHILRNLLSNAAKFTAEGRVDLSARTTAETVVLEVADTGIGIAEEDRSRVFEEFFQARSPLHAGVKGTGLGLAFAQRIAVTLGGSLELASTPGAGSRFSVRLPRKPSGTTAEGGGPA